MVEMHQKIGIGADFAIKSLQKGIFSQNLEVEVKTYSFKTYYQIWFPDTIQLCALKCE